MSFTSIFSDPETETRHSLPAGKTKYKRAPQSQKFRKDVKKSGASRP